MKTLLLTVWIKGQHNNYCGCHSCWTRIMLGSLLPVFSGFSGSIGRKDRHQQTEEGRTDTESKKTENHQRLPRGPYWIQYWVLNSVHSWIEQGTLSKRSKSTSRIIRLNSVQLSTHKRVAILGERWHSIERIHFTIAVEFFSNLL